ncbi:transferase family-domain-containing protein [Dactylonectria macrodidyma]|uniref:Transferase family-domain-containing protein n=1 Tax=Dactylonectria macrodidyma TaxID=307937 RepID=A0A9P9DKG2_9HYPO|nr:transferase family-domain-containing protein [Dactylonectria macrodidyma]
MTNTLNIERLTPLDLIMPRTYVSAHLAFRTTEPIPSILPRIQHGLEGLSKQLPWLSGKVHPTTVADGEAPGLELRWDADQPVLAVVDKGTIEESFETLSAEGMPPSALPTGVWPVPSMIDEALYARGATIFGASLFRFGDGRGVGLCISIHHNAVDATGFAEIVKLLVQNIAASEHSSLVSFGTGRLNQLSQALSSDLSTVSSESTDNLFASHPEYSKAPPAFPSEFPSSTSKVLTIPIARINSIKEAFSKSMSKTPTTNTVVSALLWSAITRARLQRNSTLAGETSRLAMAVDGRRRIGDKLSTPETPYIANAVLYSLAKLSVEDLNNSSAEDMEQSLSKVCDVISQSQSSTAITPRHIAEVYSLTDRVEDYRTIFVGWDLFSSRDLTITSWADLDLYNLNFGSDLGKPEFIRVPYTEADGVALVLPRKREVGDADASGETIEVMVMLRRDDMAVLENDGLWKTLEALRE